MVSPNILFLGSKASGLVALKKLLESLPLQSILAIVCPEDSQDHRSELSSFRVLATKYSLPLHVVKTPAETSSLILHYKPHTVLVHGWYRKLPVSSFPGSKFFGFHYSLLPEYRGNAPLVWQIIHGREQLGVSFFQLTDGIDDGDIVDQRSFLLRVDESICDAIQKANSLVLEMLEDLLPCWKDGSFPTRPQSSIPPSYCGLRVPSDGRINWHNQSRSVHNFIRSQSRPYPGAFSSIPDGRIVRFWKSEIEQRNFYGVPGSIVEITPDSIVIACGSGALRILSAETDGESQDLIPACLRSLSIRLS